MSRSSPRNAPVAPPGGTDSLVGQVPGAADPRSPHAEGRPASWPDRWTVPGVCFVLAAITFAVFGETVHFEFVNFDDNEYVYENPEVARGVTLRGIVWTFTHVHASNWHPLTWISHMLDCQLYGLNPGGHHLTNVLLHTATAVLLFLVLRRMTGLLWRSAFVAAVFAIHPLRVESVAWVAERKDVLSGVFFMLTLWAYVRYAQGGSRVEPSSLRFAAPRGPVSNAGSGGSAPGPRLWTLDYGLVLLLFALGLLSKPMLVTLPFVLLLLDYWPLGRLTRLRLVAAWRAGNEEAGIQPVGAAKRNEDGSALWRDGAKRRRLKQLLLEKLPLFGLAAASCAVTLFAQAVAIQPFGNISMALRVGNALISYVAYLGQMFCPSGLAAFYPFVAGNVRVSSVTLSLAALAGISTMVFVLRRRRPYLLTGWLWYLIMLAPVIGIVQVGGQARADRYTYLPQIGLYLLLTWAAADLCAGWRQRRVVLGGGAAIVLLALIGCARKQVSYWRNSEALWTHTLACTSDNALAHTNLGLALFQKESVDEAMVQYQEALQINPDDVLAHNDLGNALLKKGHVDKAMVQYQEALRINPDFALAHNNLGLALFKKGDVDEAMVQYQKALQINPDYALARNNLGFALFQNGRVDEAIVQYQEALEINPHINLHIAQVHDNLGNALFKRGDVDEAIAQFQEALQIDPDNEGAHSHLGSALLIKGNVAEAIAQYQKALQINPQYVETLNNLAWVLATCPQASLRNGHQAVELAQRANQLAGDGHLALLGTLAAAYAEAGRFPEAVSTAQRALQVAQTQTNTARADALRSQLKLYQAGSPFRDPEQTP